MLQRRDLTVDVINNTLHELFKSEQPFFCSCSCCGSNLERLSACTELKHCNICISSICGLKSKPAESHIDPSHWKEYFRYEEDLLDYVGIFENGVSRDVMDNCLQALRFAMHIIRFFRELPDDLRKDAANYIEFITRAHRRRTRARSINSSG